jgi:hypothetical protein
MFTFILPRKEEADEFTVSELLKESEINHDRCGGGKVEISEPSLYPHNWTLHCSRCDYQYEIELDAKGRADVCKAAIDGEERKIKVHRKSENRMILSRDATNNSEGRILGTRRL